VHLWRVRWDAFQCLSAAVPVLPCSVLDGSVWGCNWVSCSDGLAALLCCTRCSCSEWDELVTSAAQHTCSPTYVQIYVCLSEGKFFCVSGACVSLFLVVSCQFSQLPGKTFCLLCVEWDVKTLQTPRNSPSYVGHTAVLATLFVHISFSCTSPRSWVIFPTLSFLFICSDTSSSLWPYIWRVGWF